MVYLYVKIGSKRTALGSSFVLLAPSLRPRCGSYWNTQACPGGSGHGNLTRSFPRKMTYKWWVKPTSEFPGGQ